MRLSNPAKSWSVRSETLPVATLLCEAKTNEGFLEVGHRGLRIEEAEDMNPFLALDLEARQEKQAQAVRARSAGHRSN